MTMQPSSSNSINPIDWNEHFGLPGSDVSRALEESDSTKLRSLIEKDPTALNTSCYTVPHSGAGGRLQTSPLAYAVYLEKIEMIELLFELGAKPNPDLADVGVEPHCTPLGMAAQRERTLRFIPVLVKNGAERIYPAIPPFMREKALRAIQEANQNL